MMTMISGAIFLLLIIGGSLVLFYGAYRMALSSDARKGIESWFKRKTHRHQFNYDFDDPVGKDFRQELEEWLHEETNGSYHYLEYMKKRSTWTHPNRLPKKVTCLAFNKKSDLTVFMLKFGGKLNRKSNNDGSSCESSSPT